MVRPEPLTEKTVKKSNGKVKVKNKSNWNVKKVKQRPQLEIVEKSRNKSTKSRKTSQNQTTTRKVKKSRKNKTHSLKKSNLSDCSLTFWNFLIWLSLNVEKRLSPMKYVYKLCTIPGPTHCFMDRNSGPSVLNSSACAAPSMKARSLFLSAGCACESAHGPLRSGQRPLPSP